MFLKILVFPLGKSKFCSTVGALGLNQSFPPQKMAYTDFEKGSSRGKVWGRWFLGSGGA